jgi:hypothetical protein
MKKEDSAASKPKSANPQFFAKGRSAKLRSAKARTEREMLAKTSLKDLIK